MKPLDLMDYELDDLLEVLRAALHAFEFQQMTRPASEIWHGLNARRCTHLLEVLQPKHTSLAYEIRQSVSFSITNQLPEVLDLSDPAPSVSVSLSVSLSSAA
jgi:hypothetical protein